MLPNFSQLRWLRTLESWSMTPYGKMHTPFNITTWLQKSFENPWKGYLARHVGQLLTESLLLWPQFIRITLPRTSSSLIKRVKRQILGSGRKGITTYQSSSVVFQFREWCKKKKIIKKKEHYYSESFECLLPKSVLISAYYEIVSPYSSMWKQQKAYIHITACIYW